MLQSLPMWKDMRSHCLHLMGMGLRHLAGWISKATRSWLRL
jgi:hypothetical protein